jgi:hypothetical protein
MVIVGKNSVAQQKNVTYHRKKLLAHWLRWKAFLWEVFEKPGIVNMAPPLIITANAFVVYTKFYKREGLKPLNFQYFIMKTFSMQKSWENCAVNINTATI